MALFLSLDIASGLPLGKIRTAVEASFSLGEEEITAVVPIEGIVSGDLMLVGRKWDRNVQRSAARNGLRSNWADHKDFSNSQG